MSIFKTITLTWAGKEYVIPPTQVLRAIAIVENEITLHELFQYQSRGTAPISKLSTAFANVLRYAGAKVTDDEVYAAMFKGDQSLSASAAISALLFMMIPPDAGQSAGGNVSAAAAPSSKKRSKASSAATPG